MDRRWDGPGIAGLTDFEPIGAGGFATVYRARQASLDRVVAVKLLHTALSDSDEVRRFRRECEVLGRLGSHRRIVDVYDAGVGPDSRPYIVMRYYGRGSLADDCAARGRIPPEDAVMFLGEVAEAVQFGHDEGVVHRDIKPANILLSDDGHAVLADFGVAALMAPDRTRTQSAAVSRGYTAPEVLRDNQYSAASDVYSLAACAYALVTGGPPDPTRPQLSVPGAPPGLSRAILAGIAEDPAMRPSSAAVLAEQLRAGLHGDGTARQSAQAITETARAARFCVECGSPLRSGTTCDACGSGTSMHRTRVSAGSTPGATRAVPPASPLARRGPGNAVIVAAVLVSAALLGIGWAVVTGSGETTVPAEVGAPPEAAPPADHGGEADGASAAETVPADGAPPAETVPAEPSPTPAAVDPGPAPLPLSLVDSHPESAAGRSAARALDDYLYAINARDWATACAMNRVASCEQLRSGSSQSTWSRVEVQAAQRTGSAAMEVQFTARTRQPAALGPDGESCTDWWLSYGLSRSGGQWVISSSDGSHQPC